MTLKRLLATTKQNQLRRQIYAFFSSLSSSSLISDTKNFEVFLNGHNTGGKLPKALSAFGCPVEVISGNLFYYFAIYFHHILLAEQIVIEVFLAGLSKSQNFNEKNKYHYCIKVRRKEIKIDHSYSLFIYIYTRPLYITGSMHRVHREPD